MRSRAAFSSLFLALPFRRGQNFKPQRCNSQSLRTILPRCCSTAPNPPFEIMDEKRIFHHYQTIWSRTVLYSSGQTVSYDVRGNARSNFQSVFVFPFDTTKQTVTVLPEYSPGRSRETASFVAGMFEGEKHYSLEEAAQAKISEEAWLKGGQILSLTDGGVAADKYSRNGFYYYLALNCIIDEQPQERNAEEWISVQRGVALKEVKELLRDGELNTPNALRSMLAIKC